MKAYLVKPSSTLIPNDVEFAVKSNVVIAVVVAVAAINVAIRLQIYLHFLASH